MPSKDEADRREREENAKADLHARNVSSANLAAKLGKRYAECRLSNFNKELPAQAKVVSSLDRLDLAAMLNEGRGLVLYGSVGTGKDHLLAAMLFRVCDLPTRKIGANFVARKCQWINGLELLATFRDAIGEDKSERRMIESFTEADVLAISDPTPPIALRDEAWRIEILYRVLDARYRAMKSTWLSINAGSPEEADEKLTAPIFDRLRDGAEMFRCCWPSYRERKRT